MTWLLLIPLAFLNGVFGRMGGSDKYDTKWRDIGCSIIAVISVIITLGSDIENRLYPLVLGITFLLHWGAFSTYWDRLWGYDNMWFSGLMVGLAMLPLLILGTHLWLIIVLRAVSIAVIWGLLNKFLPQRVFIWRRDVAEEFLRYASLLSIGIRM